VNTVPISSSPRVRATVTALDAFGAIDQPTAARLLSMYARQKELTLAEAAEVLNHYPPTDPASLKAQR
jgi:hypothetical protein